MSPDAIPLLADVERLERELEKAMRVVRAVVRVADEAKGGAITLTAQCALFQGARAMLAKGAA